MCRKCNYHLKELYVRVNALFDKISANCELSYTLTTHTCRQVKPITSESSLSEQIKYYRSIDDIKQTDLGVKLNFHRSTLNHLENKDMKLVNVELIKGIIEELNIQDKININDEYISFLLDNPCDKIIEARQKLKLSRKDFANLLGVDISSVRRWELGNHHISRKKYERLKNLLVIQSLLICSRNIFARKHKTFSRELTSIFKSLIDLRTNSFCTLAKALLNSPIPTSSVGQFIISCI